jgi:hypothetical protein
MELGTGATCEQSCQECCPWHCRGTSHARRVSWCTMPWVLLFLVALTHGKRSEGMIGHTIRQRLGKGDRSRATRARVWPGLLLAVAALSGVGLGCGGSSAKINGSGDGAFAPGNLDSGGLLGTGGAPGTGGAGKDSGALSGTGGRPGTGGSAPDSGIPATGGTSGTLGSGGTGAGGSSPKDGGVVTCGDPGYPCCAASQCNGGGCCVSGICMAQGGVCVGLGGGTCNAGVCGASADLVCPAVGQIPARARVRHPKPNATAGPAPSAAS